MPTPTPPTTHPYGEWLDAATESSGEPAPLSRAAGMLTGAVVALLLLALLLT